MLGLVQDSPLLLPTTLVHAARNFPDVEIVSRATGGETRLDYREAERRARRLASALGSLGIAAGSTAGSLAWTNHRHFELFHAVPGLGATLHTANPRLSVEQLAYAVNLTNYNVLFIDPENIAQAEQLLPHTPKLDTFVVLAAAKDIPQTQLPNVIAYEDLLASGCDDFAWPEFDERTASTLCYTSGTTGDPKGVLYSHRGTLLNVMSVATKAGWGLSPSDAVLGISPFFHCNGWGVPYLAPMMGAKLVLPGRNLSSEALHELIVAEGVTVGAAVPTIWLGLAEYCRAKDLGLGRFNRAFIGGSAASPQLVEALFRDFGVRTIHAWGMTETTHASTLTSPPVDITLEEAVALSTVQGKPVYGCEIRIAGEDGRPLPRGGETPGELQSRGHWMASSYFKRPDVKLLTDDGWMQTGDVGLIDEENVLHITDRQKDVIKSGGEWISSLTLENEAMSHPGLQRAAAFAVPHPRWVERPMLAAVRAPGSTVTEADILAHLAKRLPRWWLPDVVVFVDDLPYSQAGKVLKSVLRERFRTAYAA